MPYIEEIKERIMYATIDRILMLKTMKAAGYPVGEELINPYGDRDDIIEFPLQHEFESHLSTILKTECAQSVDYSDELCDMFEDFDQTHLVACIRFAWLQELEEEMEAKGRGIQYRQMRDAFTNSIYCEYTSSLSAMFASDDTYLPFSHYNLLEPYTLFITLDGWTTKESFSCALKGFIKNLGRLKDLYASLFGHYPGETEVSNNAIS